MGKGGSKKILAEAVGTAVLVFMGCGSAVFLGCEPSGGLLAVALAFGLSIVAMAHVIGGVSGCHINPAVSLAALIDGRIGIMDFWGYLAAQFVGAIAGGALLKVVSGLAGVDLTGALGSNATGGAGGIGGALLVETVLTFIFVLTVLGVTADASKNGVAGVVIGLTLTFVHIVGIPLTGTSVNPARSLGPAIFSGSFDGLWVFVAGPFLGAALAAFTYRIFASPPRGKK